MVCGSSREFFAALDLKICQRNRVRHKSVGIRITVISATMEYNYARRQAYFDNHQYLGRLDILINSKVSHLYRAEQMNSWMVSCIKWFKHKQYTKMGCSTKWYKKEDQRNPSLGSKLSITIYWSFSQVGRLFLSFKGPWKKQGRLRFSRFQAWMRSAQNCSGRWE